MPTIQIFPDANALASAATALILQAAHEAIAARGRFTIALTGGSSPVKSYEQLARITVEQAHWDKWEVFLGDDRFVPPDDPRSNYGQAQRTLLAHVPIPTDQIHPVPTNAATPEEAAAQYAETLGRVFALPDRTHPPVFDLILLGLGDDGHCASLFPHMPTLAVTNRRVISSPPGTLPPPVDRVTMTFPVLNAARQVVFMVPGEKKAPAVRDILERGSAVEVHPAAGIQPASGALTWLLDDAAASLLTHKQQGHA